MGVEVHAAIELGECDIEYRVCGDHIELQLGGMMHGLTVDASERGLENLVKTGAQALRDLRALPEGADPEDE
jgi:hypothetical protein